MAAEKHTLTMSFIAGSDLSASSNLYKFVELSPTGTVSVCNNASDRPIGVLQSLANSGRAVSVTIAGISKVQADGNLAIGDQIGTSGDGQADAKIAGADTTEYVVGTVLEDTGAAGEYTMCAINCMNPHRAS